MKKGVAPPKGKGFNAADYAREGCTEAEVAELKQAFDLFDTDQGGSIDTKGNSLLIQNLKPPWSPSASTLRTL